MIQVVNYQKLKGHSMENKILIAYASSYGSTEEIARVIFGQVTEHGQLAAIKQLRDVRSLDDYSAVIIGAPIYMFHWHKEAKQFLARFKNEISSGKPVAVFAGGPFGEGTDSQWKEIKTRFDQEMNQYPWFKPVSTLMVGGRFDPAKLRFPYSLIPALRQMPASDVRNWNEIHAWAAEVTRIFETTRVEL